MSCRQFEILFACLAGVLWSATVAPAQVDSHASAQERLRVQRGEPAPLRQGGFIQQLRAVPPGPAQILQEQEVDARAFRLPARSQAQQPHNAPAGSTRASSSTSGTTDRLFRQSNSEAHSPQHADPSATPGESIQRLTQREMSLSPAAVAAQQLPPTYSELQSRSAVSRRLRGEQGRQANTAAKEHSGVAASLSDRQEAIDAETVGSYSSSEPYADPYIVVASNQSRPKSMSANAGSQLPSYQLSGPTQGSGEPRNEAFDALTAESLRQAPRVSRVPLPRSAVQDNRSRDSAQEAPERILATPASTTPQLGGTRASNATLRTAISDERTIAEVSPRSASLPSTSLPTLSTPRLQGSVDEHSAPLELPSLPSTTSADIDAAADADRQSNENMLPALPEAADSSTVSRDTSLSDRTESTEMTLPSFGAVTTDVSLPEISMLAAPSASASQETPPSTLNANANSTADKAGSAQVQTPSAGSPGQSLKADQSLKAAPSLKTEQRLKMEAPRLSVVLNGPSDLPIGSPADYEIVVRNQDSFDLHGLILRLDIPAGVKVQTHQPTHGDFELETAADGLTMVTWGFEHLAAGQTATAPMQLVAGSAKNFAVAMEWTLMPVAGSSDIAVRAPQLELALEGPAEVRFGEPNVYRLHIRNPGNAPAEQIAVRLSAERFGSSAAEIAHIAPGEEEVINVELTFNERGSINIDAVAQEQTGLASQTAIAVVVRQAIVEAQLLTASLVFHSAPTECRVSLTNHGDADARGMQAVLVLPEGAGLVATPTGAVLKGRELTWPVDKLIAGSSEEFVVQLKLTAPGSNALSLQCSGPGNVYSSAQAVTHVESITDLKLFVEAPPAPAPVGGEVTYELTLTNRGSKAATNVIVVAQFSEGIEPIRSEGHAARVVPGQALFEPLPGLAAGETVNLKVIAQAATAGSHRFRVEVRSDDSQVRLVQEESTRYLESAGRIAAPPSSGSTLR